MKILDAQAIILSNAVKVPTTAFMPATRQLIAQAGHAIGDQVALAALLLHDPTCHVLISRCEADPQDRSGDIRAFYQSCGIPETRLHVIETADLHDPAALDTTARDWAGPSGPLCDLNLTTAGSGAGLHYLQTQWGQKAVDDAVTLPALIRHSWGCHPDIHAAPWSTGESPAALRQRLRERGLSPQDIEGKKVAVIWSPGDSTAGCRASNQQHDIPCTAWSQVMQDVAAAALGSDIDLLILAGENITSGGSSALSAPIGTVCPVVDLTGLWNSDDLTADHAAPTAGQPPAQAQAPAPAGVDGHEHGLLRQLALHDHLATQSAALIHLGPHSSVLEALTLLGHHVGSLLLIPDPGLDRDSTPSRPGYAAAEIWSGLPGTGLHYTPLLLDASPAPAHAAGFIELDRTVIAAFIRASLAQIDIQRRLAQQKALNRSDRAGYLISLRALAQSQTARKAALQSQLNVIDTRQQRLALHGPDPGLNGDSLHGQGPTLEEASASAGANTVTGPDTHTGLPRPASAPASFRSQARIARHLAHQKKRSAALLEKVTHSLANTQQALSLLDDPDLSPAPTAPASTGSLKLPSPV